MNTHPTTAFAPRSVARRCDGSRFPAEALLCPLDMEEEPMTVARIVDLCSRRQPQESFNRLIEAVPCGMLMVDAEQRITLANEHLLRLFGYSRAELLGQPVGTLIPVRLRARHAAHVDGYAARPGRRAMGPATVLTALHRDGSEFLVEIGLSPVESDSGCCVLATVVDVTERMLMEQRLKRVNADLEEFAYVAAHDLRAPLRGIGELADWISQDLGEAAPPGIRKNLERLRLRVSRLDALIENLLKYARANIGDTEAETVDVAPWLATEVELLDLPDTVHIGITTLVEQITILKTPLGTVLRNLVSNAVKHNDGEGAAVSIEVREEGALLCFCVSDNGPGIPEGSRERIFKLFQRLSTAAPGNGIGLALVKRIVEAHGGSISVADREDGLRGSTFRVLWPRTLLRNSDV